MIELSDLQTEIISWAVTVAVLLLEVALFILFFGMGIVLYREYGGR